MIKTCVSKLSCLMCAEAPTPLGQDPGPETRKAEQGTFHLREECFTYLHISAFSVVALETVGVQRPARWSSRGEQIFRETRPRVACGAEEDVEAD